MAGAYSKVTKQKRIEPHLVEGGRHVKPSLLYEYYRKIDNDPDSITFFFFFLTFRSNSKKKKEKGKEKINTSRDSNGTPMAPFPL